MNRKQSSRLAVVVALLLTCATAAVAQSSATPEAGPTGDPEKGRALYAGAAPFAKGGAPCLACHGIAGMGRASAASFGPDLTALFNDYGAEGVSSILESLPFPSMEPIYANRPLTEAERADLTAFFQASAELRPAEDGGSLLLHGAIATVVFLALAWAFGRNRLRTVRRSLVERAVRPAKGKGEPS